MPDKLRPIMQTARFYRPPLVGVVALTVVFMALPLTHSLSVFALNFAGPENSFWIYVPIGTLALLALIWGVRRNREISGTLTGFVTGMLLWTGWASYAFRFNEISLGLPMPALDGEKTWPNNLLYIEGSFGICVVTLLYFTLNRETRCNAFRWLQRTCRIDLGRQDSAQARNFCAITFIETVYVTWFCYAGSLFLADPRFVGYDNPAAYVIITGLALWGLYLFWRLMKFTRIMAGIRYAIPTKAILWITFGEALPKYGWYEEVWLRPWDYPKSMLGLLAFFVVLFLVTPLLPQRRVMD